MEVGVKTTVGMADIAAPPAKPKDRKQRMQAMLIFLDSPVQHVNEEFRLLLIAGSSHESSPKTFLALGLLTFQIFRHLKQKREDIYVQW